MLTATKYDGTVFNIGDEVRYHSFADGWRFGKVIGLHLDGTTQRTTIRFFARGDEFAEEDIALPLFRVDRCRQHNEDPTPNQMAY